MLSGDPWMAHSLLSGPLNLGLLDPLELVRRVESAYRAGDVPIASAEGFIRQVIGWRDYIWNLYWHLGPEYRRRLARQAADPPVVCRIGRRRHGGPSQYADGGMITTKPYAGGGAYIDRMSDYCGGCTYRPTVRVGDQACPFTAG